MAETSRDKRQTPASPPSEGRQDHDAMRVDAMLPVTGGASTDALAAAGGLNVPGSDPAATSAIASTLATTASRHEPIPGERDASTLTYRQSGAMGASSTGEDVHVDLDATLGDRTRRERKREGGGGHG